jgi:hypothetical protein
MSVMSILRNSTVVLARASESAAVVCLFVVAGNGWRDVLIPSGTDSVVIHASQLRAASEMVLVVAAVVAPLTTMLSLITRRPVSPLSVMLIAVTAAYLLPVTLHPLSLAAVLCAIVMSKAVSSVLSDKNHPSAMALPIGCTADPELVRLISALICDRQGADDVEVARALAEAGQHLRSINVDDLHETLLERRLSIRLPWSQPSGHYRRRAAGVERRTK